MENGRLSYYHPKRRIGKRKCLNCHGYFTPDSRNHYHQRYCSKPSCRQRSKKISQERWLLSTKGQGYFQGPDNVRRVKEWRATHPGYWKRGKQKDSTALQDVLPSELVSKQCDTRKLAGNALQDVCSAQPALLIGLIASLTGSALQDEIVETSRRFIISGRDILGIGLENKPKGGSRNGDKTHSLSGSSSSSSQAVQLGGS
jgi:hypothetical protein